jgi:hypothetical protein
MKKQRGSVFRNISIVEVAVLILLSQFDELAKKYICTYMPCYPMLCYCYASRTGTTCRARVPRLSAQPSPLVGTSTTRASSRQSRCSRRRPRGHFLRCAWSVVLSAFSGAWQIARMLKERATRKELSHDECAAP